MVEKSQKTERKNHINTLQESIARVQTDITLYKSEGNTKAVNAYEKVLKRLQNMLLELKRK